MMMDVAGGVIIGLFVSAVFAAGIYCISQEENGVGATLLLISLGAALWIVLD